MNRAGIFKIIFIMACIIQIWFVVSQIISRERTLKNGALLKFKIRPVNYYDFFRGKYILLNIDNRVEINRISNIHKGKSVYALINKDQDSYSYIQDITNRKPDDHAYIRARVMWISRKYGADKYIVKLKLPFERYYIEEKFINKLKSSGIKLQSQKNAYITVSSLKGEAVLEELYIDDRPFSEMI